MASGHSADGWARAQDRVPGARRQKVLGYIKAANEIRQSYQSQFQSRGTDNDGMPGSFPDSDFVRSGDEEMLLFPSYARKHIARKERSGGTENGKPGSQDNIERPGEPGDADYWRREWEKYEDANAIVDVDVRGWLFSPQKGPLNRRNRLLLAVARRLSGIPAPDQPSDESTDHNLAHSLRYKTQEAMMSQEEEAAAREAEMIARHGQKEADAALRGSYSSDPSRRHSATDSRSNSPSRLSIKTDVSDDPSKQYGLFSRASWGQSTDMSREELVKANDQLMTRLRPFMTLPTANTSITVFFYNDEKSISKSVHTDESGHFNLRAALGFIPSKVRVLASDKLSAVEDVIITESRGISLISDIDDTIKHSAIAGGAREIFKNTFIRDHGDLIINGVREWYTKMSQLGVKLHYVSNSPWQLYPVLKSYFTLAGLPAGSIHLKQYSGMLQGIFEPAAERKKGSLEKIFYDFPERKFILVGDSGEADLEVYTDIVLANPGRVLGVFIRDVTTPEKQSEPSSSRRGSNNENANSSDRSDDPTARPGLPLRPKTQSPTRQVEEDLIDFSDDPPPNTSTTQTSSYESDLRQLQGDKSGRPQPPSKPAKPSNLRSSSTASPVSNTTNTDGRSESSEAKKPPLPPKPRRSATSNQEPNSSRESQRQTSSSSQQQQQQSTGPRPGMESRSASSYSVRNEEDGYIASARRHLTTAYNALPALRSQSPTRDGYDSQNRPSGPRRGLTAYPAAAARWATGATGGDPTAGGDGGLPGAPYNKKEEFWKRRWARAEELFRSKGVVLKTWRVGSDVMDECLRLTERALKESGNRRNGVGS